MMYGLGLPLIGKPMNTFAPEDYVELVRGMYSLRQKGAKKPASPAPGLSITRNKKGALTLRRSKARTFAYVTFPELAALAASAQTNQSDLWNLFKAKKYIIAQTRMDAERAYAAQTGVTL